jgi:HK97 family phage portal protein
MFNWFKRLIRGFSNPAVPLWTPGAFNYLGSPRSTSGVAVDRTTVLSYPAVWRALNLISHKIARLPLQVYKRNKKGGREVDLLHPAQWLLYNRPSSLYTPFTFKSTLIQHALLHGNGFAWILRDDMGRPEELVILNPETTGVAMDNGQLYYFVRMGQLETKKILPENVLHVKGMGHDGIVGYSVLDHLRESFGLGLAAQRYGSVFFRNNGAPGPLIIKFPAGIGLAPKDKEQLEQLRQQLEKTHGGVDNSHKPMILSNGGDVTTLTIDHDSMQFLETRQFEVACGICNIFGVPSWKLGIHGGHSYNSLEVEERSFLHDTLDAWMVAFEEECEAKLLKESQAIRDSHFVSFDRRDLEQADYDKKCATLLSLVNGGMMTVNEGRDELNMPGVGPDGDELRIPTSVQPDEPENDQENDQAPEGNGLPGEDSPENGTSGPTEGNSPTGNDPVDSQPVRAAESGLERPEGQAWELLEAR